MCKFFNQPVDERRAGYKTAMQVLEKYHWSSLELLTFFIFLAFLVVLSGSIALIQLSLYLNGKENDVIQNPKRNASVSYLSYMMMASMLPILYFAYRKTCSAMASFCGCLGMMLGCRPIGVRHLFVSEMSRKDQDELRTALDRAGSDISVDDAINNHQTVYTLLETVRGQASNIPLQQPLLINAAAP